MTTIRHGGPCGLRIEMRSAEREEKSVVFHATEGRMVFATRSEGGCGRIPAQGVAKPLSAICLIPLWLSAVNRPARFRRGRKAGTRATPPKAGGHVTPIAVLSAYRYPAPWGRSRPHLSLREGSESKRSLGVCSWKPPPFPLALHRVGSVLAVKGSLRRFAPWTAPGRSERRAAYEGKGGFGPWGAEAAEGFPDGNQLAAFRLHGLFSHRTQTSPANPTDQIVAHTLGFSSSAVNLSRIFFEHLHPILDVSGRALWVVPHIDALTRHHGSNLGA